MGLGRLINTLAYLSRLLQQRGNGRLSAKFPKTLVILGRFLVPFLLHLVPLSSWRLLIPLSYPHTYTRATRKCVFLPIKIVECLDGRDSIFHYFYILSA